LQDEYTLTVQKMREDVVSLAAKATRLEAGVEDGHKWQLMSEMLMTVRTI
jgi:hypothetical protein